MKRREYILGTVSLGGIVSTAGCLEALTGKNPQKAAEHIETSLVLMNESSNYFSQIQSDVGSEPSTYTFDKTYVTRRVTEARSELTKAEALATEKQLQTILALREWLDVHESQAALMAALINGAKGLNRALAYNNAGEYDQALTEIEVAKTDFEVAEQSIQTVRAEFEDLKGQNLSGVSRIEYQDLEQNIGFNEDAVPEFQTQAEIIRSQIMGNESLSTAVNAMNEGNYLTAQQELETAVESYQTAVDLADDLMNSNPGEENPGLIQTQCVVENSYQGSQSLLLAAEEFEAGNIQNGEEIQSSALETLNESCGGSD